MDDFFLPMLAHIIRKLKLDPTHQVWQSQHGELGSHCYPHLGSCSIGHNFAAGTVTSNLTNLSDLSLEKCTCYFGQSNLQIHPHLFPCFWLPTSLSVSSRCCSAPWMTSTYSFLLLCKESSQDSKQEPSQETSCATWDRVGEKTQEDEATFIRFDSLRDL